MTNELANTEETHESTMITARRSATAILQAETPEEHDHIDDQLSVVQDIMRRLGMDRDLQDKIGAIRVWNLRKLRRVLDADDSYGRGRPPENGMSNTNFNSRSMTAKLANELGGWPLDEWLEWRAEQRRRIQQNGTEKITTAHGVYKVAKNWRLDKMRSEAEYTPVSVPGADIINADFKEVMTQMEPESVHLIFTDPPYHDEFAPEYEEMARLAARVLIPGGSLITYFGHNSAPVVLPRMANHLRFWWLCGVRHTGGRKTLPGKNVRVHWKPLAWFVKEGRATSDHVDDLIGGDIGEKERHEWAQGEGEAAYYIRMLTEPENIVLDPFMGSGTTGVAALNLHREFVGVEKDKDRWNKAAERLQNR